MSMFLLALMRKELVSYFRVVSSLTNLKYLLQADKAAFEGDPPSRRSTSNENQSVSVSPEILSLHCETLSRSALYVDLVYNLVICVECSEALDHRHVHTHVLGHRFPCPPIDELTTILCDIGITEFPLISPSEVIPPITGLKLQDGFLCTLDSCGVAFGSKSSLQRHYQECHMAEPMSFESCKIHRIFGFRGHQIVVRVNPSLAVQRPHGNLAEYLSLMRPQENPSFRPLNPSNDPRKMTGFLHSARWFDVIRGLPLKELVSLVAVPLRHDCLSAVMDETNVMFGQMWDIVDAMEVLPRRHIHTPKGYVVFLLVRSCI
jgi:hypothetical protein